MAKIRFIPIEKSIEAIVDQKLLVAARKNNIPIRYGCASCRCGTCAVKISAPGAFHPMTPMESDLLSRMRLPITGEVRLACQARQTAQVDTSVDLSFQDTYSPDDGDGDGSI